MELDDLKNTWQQVNSQEAIRPDLSEAAIEEMIKGKYRSNLKRIAYPEIIGVIICLIAALYIGVNFGTLGTRFLQVVGIVTILLLILLSVLSIVSLAQLNSIGELQKPYAETLKEFAGRKLQFFRLQKINVTLSFLLMVAVVILLSKFFTGKDISGNKYFWTFSFTVGYLFLLFYSKWVLKYYQQTLSKTEELLANLKS